jgi:glutaredoxin
VSGSRARVTVYSRPGCHLCDEALELIRGIDPMGLAFDLEVIDIESDDELMKRYLERIPVVEVRGEVVSELVFDLEPLRARLGIA